MSSRPRYKITEVGEIPEEWKAVRLQSVAQVCGGSTPSTRVTEYWNGDIPFVTPTDVTGLKGNNFIRKTEKRITQRGLESISAKLLPPGSVLVTSRASIGFAAVNEVPMVTNQGFVNIVCGEIIHNLFLLYLIRHFVAKLTRLASGSTFKEVSRTSLKRMLIPLPPLPEQQRIALVLSTVDDAIQKTGEIIEKTRQLKRGLMQQLLTKGIGHTRFKRTEMGEIPEEWTVVTLGNNLISVLPGYAFDSGFFDNEQGVPLIRVRDIGKGRTEAKYRGSYDTKYLIKAGDILVGMDGEFEVHKWGGPGALLNQRVCKVSSEDPSSLDEGFLFYALQGPIKSIERTISLTTVKHLSTKDLYRIRIALPLHPEQHEIALILSGVDAKVQKERQCRQRLEELKTGLMQALLTGKVRVRVS